MKYDKISIKIFKFFLFSVQFDYSDVYYIVNYTKIYSVKIKSQWFQIETHM